MIITIDGPTASGKSTVARIIAQKLNIFYLNSGLLYRALAYYYSKLNIQEDKLNNLSLEQIKNVLNKTIIYSYTQELGARTLLNNTDITFSLKDATIDKSSSIIAKNTHVREAILDYQRYFESKHNLVADGRDCGTVVFPRAQYKFFLTASLQVRALRWQADQLKKLNSYTVEQALKIIQDKDHRDRTRTISPLVAAPDAVLIDNSELNIEQTVQKIIDSLNKKPS